MDKEQLVSVAMATYNGAHYLRAQIDSILVQSYRNFELVISDDGSKDETASIVREYAKRDQRIRTMIHTVNLGYVKNFERAIAACHGDIIFLSDQDDVWDPRKIEIMLSRMDGYSLIYSDAVIVDDKLVVLKPSFNALKEASFGVVPFLNLLDHNKVTGCTCAFKREIFALAQPFPASVYHDYWLALVASSNGGVLSIPDRLVKYRQHGGNALGAGLGKHLRRSFPDYSAKVEAKRATMDLHGKKIIALLELLSERISRSDARDGRNLALYYQSYSESFFRPLAFLFYFRKGRIFSWLRGGKRFRRLVSSFFGYRCDHVWANLTRGGR
jgi:glycosyltransferase involved in cell wall biosynthesis